MNGDSEGFIQRVLELARWAPSGDNAQPWRFELVDPQTVRIHLALDLTNPYEFNQGQPTVLAAGFLLESLRLAASQEGRDVAWRVVEASASRRTIEVTFLEPGSAQPDGLATMIVRRSVDRRPFRLRPLTEEQKRSLEDALKAELTIRWYETAGERLSWARLNALTTDLRLRLPETYPVHKAILDWHNDQSPTGIPARAIGADPLLLHIMRWVLATPERARRFNALPMSTLSPRLELDIVPGFFCAAFFAIALEHPASSFADEKLLKDDALLSAGMRLQRFWLTATGGGLVVQPTLAPLAFDHYARNGSPLLTAGACARRAKRVTPALRGLLGDDCDPRTVVFVGRIGTPRRVSGARSTRRDLEDLYHNGKGPGA